MKILHYSLGLPPYRSGGLTKYSFDLMKKQVEQGEQVFLLFPGQMRFINRNHNIKYYKRYSGINIYELINPLPVPLLKGICNPEKFCSSTNKNIFIEFLREINVDIVHIHTFMGLYKEFLEACKVLKIKIVYTTHDYFGLCTKVNFINSKGELCENRDIDRCIECNLSGYRINTIKILQSKTYRYIKSKGLINKIKKKIISVEKDNVDVADSKKNISSKKINKDSYIELLKYYEDMYKHIDYFLFNSSLAKEIYDKYIKLNGKVINITHSNIQDNRVIKNYDNNKLKITYLGPYKKYKGFNLLVNVMNEIERDGNKDIILSTYGDEINNINTNSNININGKYDYEGLKDIFEKTDLLLVPSIWNETFGFITLEALSYGVPVLLTNKVGSKDLIRKFDEDMIVNSVSEDLKRKIIEIYNDRNILKKINKKIVEDDFIFTIDKQYYDIRNLYKKVLEVK